MQSLTREQQQLVELLGHVYHEILPLEEQFGLFISNKDQRPRIDYFFDALRALTNSDMPTLLRLERLSLEWLAYDATAIRYIEHKPLAVLSPHHAYQSPGLHIRKEKTDALTTQRTANREDKKQLSTLYLRFGVMFVALFKPFADRDHRDRVEELEEQAQELTNVSTAIEGLGQGTASVTELEEAAKHCHDPEMKKLVQALLERQRYKQSAQLRGSLTAVESRIDQKNREIETVQHAHLNLSANQLALYEIGKDVVKELAGQGLNVAGQHLNQALTQTNQLGRGR